MTPYQRQRIRTTVLGVTTIESIDKIIDYGSHLEIIIFPRFCRGCKNGCSSIKDVRLIDSAQGLLLSASGSKPFRVYKKFAYISSTGHVARPSFYSRNPWPHRARGTIKNEDFRGPGSFTPNRQS